MSISGYSVSDQPSLSPLRWRKAWLSIDQNPQAIAFVKSVPGLLTVNGAFLLAVAVTFQLSMAAMALTAMTLMGMLVFSNHRLQVLVGASAFYFAVRPFRIDGWKQTVQDVSPNLALPGGALTLQLMAVGAVLLMAWGFLAWQKGNPQNRIAKRPVLALISIWFALFAIALQTVPGSATHALAWSVVGVFVSSIWILGYSASDQKTKDPTSAVYRGAFLRPFWGGGAAPIGKSFGYLNKFAAKDDDDLATTRLKAIKLAVWAAILMGVLQASRYLFHDVMDLPVLQSAILAQADSQTVAPMLGWGSLFSNYLVDLLVISVWGHVIVATVRMAGYRIPRNTHNPLASRTLAEFWNRYFFYFKEMLVDFFFYPAFVRFFKTNLKVRIAFATFCAAGLGNFLYHLMRETYVFADGEFLDKLWIFQSAVFYSLALAMGLIISQWRAKKLSPEDGFWRYQVIPRVNVIAFFCFLKIFDDISGEGTFTERLAFAASLFGV